MTPDDNRGTTETALDHDHPLKETHVAMLIRIFDGEPQHALVRKTITVERLIEEIFKEFNKDQQLDPNSNYALMLHGTRLDRDTRIEQINWHPDDELRFEYRQFARAPELLAKKSVSDATEHHLVLLSKQGTDYDVRKFPALVGRPNPARRQTKSVTVDLSDLPEARTISRPHARITKRDGAYWIESIKQNNMVILNSKSLPLGEASMLSDGDTVQLGRAILTVNLTRM